MNKIKNEDLLKITGGVNLTATFLSSVAKCLDALLEIGRSIGSAIRRFYSDDLC